MKITLCAVSALVLVAVVAVIGICIFFMQPARKEAFYNAEEEGVIRQLIRAWEQCKKMQDSSSCKQAWDLRFNIKKKYPNINKTLVNSKSLTDAEKHLAMKANASIEKLTLGLQQVGQFGREGIIASLKQNNKVQL
jgi:hypothetical protein